MLWSRPAPGAILGKVWGRGWPNCRCRRYPISPRSLLSKGRQTEGCCARRAPPTRKSIGEGELALSLEHGLSAGMAGEATPTETVEVARAGVNSNMGGHGVYNPAVAEPCNLHHYITEPLDQRQLLSRISPQTQNLSEPGHAWVSLLWAGTG